MLKSGKLRFVGGKPFKRWTSSKKSRLVESLLFGLPPGSIVIDGSGPTWYVAEGSETLSAIYEYLKNSYSLDNVMFEADEYFQRYFSDLPLRLQSSLFNLEIIATVVNPDTPDLYRLWTYSSSLLKIGREGELWRCVEAVYPEPSGKLCDEAFRLGLSDARLLWRAILALVFSDRFKTGRFNRLLNLEHMRYDIFECTMLERFEVLRMYASNATPDTYRMTPEIADLTETALDYGEYVWTEKKTAVFTIVLTLITNDTGHVPGKGFIHDFIDAWKECAGIGTGHLYKDYARKTSAIYKYLTRCYAT